MGYLFGGYAAFFLITIGYLWSLHRRETLVEREIDLVKDDEEAHDVTVSSTPVP